MAGLCSRSFHLDLLSLSGTSLVMRAARSAVSGIDFAVHVRQSAHWEGLHLNRKSDPHEKGSGLGSGGSSSSEAAWECPPWRTLSLLPPPHPKLKAAPRLPPSSPLLECRPGAFSAARIPC
ncbi:hypothetical protein NN561_002141 [Cricetulus griseus]